jgi:hypothetical protein
MERPSYAAVGANFPSAESIEELNASRSTLDSAARIVRCLFIIITREIFERKPLWSSAIMKATILLFGFLALECWASEPAPRLTGERLVEYLYYSSDNFSDRDILERGFAQGYLAGLADITQGKTWCDAWKIKPDEVDGDVFHTLRKLPQERLREKASVLVTETLGKKYPCK